jgi:hypothetical protein
MGEHKTNPNVTEAKPRCGSCPHFYAEGRPGFGHCRRHPPTCFMIQGQDLAGKPVPVPMSFYAPTQAHLGCGEHPEFMRWMSRFRAAAMESGALEQAET